MIRANDVREGMSLVSRSGERGLVIEVVRLDEDPDHVGLRIYWSEGVTSAVFRTTDPMAVA